MAASVPTSAANLTSEPTRDAALSVTTSEPPTQAPTNMLVWTEPPSEVSTAEGQTTTMLAGDADEHMKQQQPASSTQISGDFYLYSSARDVIEQEALVALIKNEIAEEFQGAGVNNHVAHTNISTSSGARGRLLEEEGIEAEKPVQPSPNCTSSGPAKNIVFQLMLTQHMLTYSQIEEYVNSEKFLKRLESHVGNSLGNPVCIWKIRPFAVDDQNSTTSVVGQPHIAAVAGGGYSSASASLLILVLLGALVCCLGCAIALCNSREKPNGFKGAFKKTSASRYTEKGMDPSSMGEEPPETRRVCFVSKPSFAFECKDDIETGSPCRIDGINLEISDHGCSRSLEVRSLPGYIDV